MKTSTSCSVALAALLSFASALPSSRAQLSARIPAEGAPASVSVTLRGATPEAFYTLSVPLNAPAGESTPTASQDPGRLSISYVEYDHSIATCIFYGVDGKDAAAAVVVESNNQLGPPQTIHAVWCTPVH
ncbi:hypothetical protein PZA11_005831 [Diplocarpon coronariae]|uniref:Uncharacterized protein n=1 Tax=Diplocarpon coronariae TaxID=2795749 RepID=A0A218Z2M4_9HELO|nr:hypothetical protein JHW43_003916 [Diplocarpon mali]OWP02277.1 hypothetical protein B2J93_1239 [Marssonina coronariae]